ncbi:hypothetical protein D3C78_1934620 [compost metagenome]
MVLPSCTELISVALSSRVVGLADCSARAGVMKVMQIALASRLRVGSGRVGAKYDGMGRVPVQTGCYRKYL